MDGGIGYRDEMTGEERASLRARIKNRTLFLPKLSLGCQLDTCVEM